jgi:hypothetical protein
MKIFWKWLALFAWNKIKTDPDPKTKYGIPGVRDIYNPCESFIPGKFKNIGFNHCDSDGHYLCKECGFYKPEEQEEQE